jgi:glucosyl-dolichyl phosphate glucuronosyltransferase
MENDKRRYATDLHRPESDKILTAPVLSAVLCTRNRRSLLPAALECLASQTLPRSAFEILVVDNASTDGTADYVRKKMADLSNLRLVQEPVAGLSRARNTGVSQSRSPKVAFLDDDASPSPDWLEKILESFAGPEAPVCVGGPVEAELENERPVWLTDDMMDFLTVLDHGAQRKILPEGKYVVGTNMAFDKHSLLQAGGFHSDFTDYNDEVFVQKRIRKNGGGILYDPQVRMKHRIPEARLSKKWFLKRWFRQGAANALLDLNEMPMPPEARLGKTFAKTKSCLGYGLKFLAFCASGAPDERFQECKMPMAEAGYLGVLLGVIH